MKFLERTGAGKVKKGVFLNSKQGEARAGERVELAVVSVSLSVAVHLRERSLGSSVSLFLSFSFFFLEGVRGVLS